MGAVDLLKMKGRELIDFATTVETKGEEFYRRLAAMSEDLKASELFHQLAQEEKAHKSLFAQLGETLAGENFPESYPGEYNDYLSSLVENHLVFKPANVEQLLSEEFNYRSALDIALAFEKDSLLLFTELAELVGERDKAIIVEIIKTEKQHIAKIRNILKNI